MWCVRLWGVRMWGAVAARAGGVWRLSYIGSGALQCHCVGLGDGVRAGGVVVWGVCPHPWQPWDWGLMRVWVRRWMASTSTSNPRPLPGAVANSQGSLRGVDVVRRCDEQRHLRHRAMQDRACQRHLRHRAHRPAGDGRARFTVSGRVGRLWCATPLRHTRAVRLVCTVAWVLHCAVAVRRRRR